MGGGEGEGIGLVVFFEDWVYNNGLGGVSYG